MPAGGPGSESYQGQKQQQKKAVCIYILDLESGRNHPQFLPEKIIQTVDFVKSTHQSDMIL